MCLPKQNYGISGMQTSHLKCEKPMDRTGNARWNRGKVGGSRAKIGGVV